MPALATRDQNPLQQLSAQGRSVRLNYIRANLITSVTLERMIREDVLTGLTSNPSICRSTRSAGARRQRCATGKAGPSR